jgi:NADH:ubiquinone oxidoreductase subunit F (NADH-binding)
VPGFLLPDRPIGSIDEWLATEVGGLGVERAQAMGPAATIDVMQRSGLRGRGGAGFPTGRKWASVAGAGRGAGTRYLVCNAAEGEPATFKDRALMRANPYQLVEGMIIAAFAVGAAEAFICLKASFEREIAAVTRAVEEFQRAGICEDCQVTVVSGPEEYLFGEEKAMLEVIEGKPPLPRLLAPYEHGLFATGPQEGWEAVGGRPARPGWEASNPTLVNNAETLSNVPHILARGPDWFRSMGTSESPGTIVCTMVGDVVAPDVGELEMGTPLGDAIDAVGSGMGAGRRMKAAFSGVANPVLTADALGVGLSYEAMQRAGSGLGAAGFFVLDDTACMVNAALLISRFLYVESCGQCPPCKLGSEDITGRLERIEAGIGDELDIEQMQGWLVRVTDGARCYLATQEQRVVASVLERFPEEIVAHIEGERCPRPRPLLLPKLVDLADGRAVYDERQARKQPDWTYR